MDRTLLISLVRFAFIASITPGPDNRLPMSSVALFGWRRSLPHPGGVLPGFAVVVASAVFGLGALVDRFPWMIAVGLVTCTAWLFAGDVLSHCLGDGRSASRANAVTGLLIVATATLVLFG